MNTTQHWRLSVIALIFSVGGIVIFGQLSRMQFGPEAEYLLNQSDIYAGTWMTAALSSHG